jgi:hypothetical protein
MVDARYARLGPPSPQTGSRRPIQQNQRNAHIYDIMGACPFRALKRTLAGHRPQNNPQMSPSDLRPTTAGGALRMDDDNICVFDQEQK